MWKINKVTLIFVALPFIVIGIIFIVLGFHTPPGARTGDGYPLDIFFFLMGGTFIVIIVAIIGGIILWNSRKLKEIEWFKKFGIPGTGEIISAEQTGVYINNLPQVRLKLNIITGAGSPYTITIKRVFNLLEIGKLIPGARLQLLIDPRRPQRVLIL